MVHGSRLLAHGSWRMAKKGARGSGRGLGQPFLAMNQQALSLEPSSMHQVSNIKQGRFDMSGIVGGSAPRFRTSRRFELQLCYGSSMLQAEPPWTLAIGLTENGVSLPLKAMSYSQVFLSSYVIIGGQ